MPPSNTTKQLSVLPVETCIRALMHIYEVRPRKDYRGVNLISDVLPYGRLWYGEPDAISNAIGYAKFRSRSHDAVIRVFDEAGKSDRNARARGRVQRTVNRL